MSATPLKFLKGGTGELLISVSQTEMAPSVVELSLDKSYFVAIG